MNNSKANSFTLHAHDIPEASGLGFRHNEKDLFAVKINGKIFIYINNCPHLNVKLNWQDNQFLDSSNSMIQCANHGALFVIETGKCVAGPCTGRKLTAVPFDNTDGIISLR